MYITVIAIALIKMYGIYLGDDRVKTYLILIFREAPTMCLQLVSLTHSTVPLVPLCTISFVHHTSLSTTGIRVSCLTTMLFQPTLPSFLIKVQIPLPSKLYFNSWNHHSYNILSRLIFQFLLSKERNLPEYLNLIKTEYKHLITKNDQLNYWSLLVSQ